MSLSWFKPVFNWLAPSVYDFTPSLSVALPLASCGRYLNKVDSFEFPGLTGMEKMASIMQKLRDDPPAELAGHKVVKVTDYKKPEETGLPAANVLIYTLENGATVVVRPSGTEPKIKTYFTTLGKDLAEAQAQKDALAAAIEPILK